MSHAKAQRCKARRKENTFAPLLHFATLRETFLLFQEFASVAAGAVGDFRAGEHARQFFNATRFV